MRAKKIDLILSMGFVACFGCGVFSCASEEPSDEAMIVPANKADNFLSSNAQEYMVEGVTTVTIEAELQDATSDEKMQRVHELIPLKQIVIGWFLNKYVGPKSGDDPNKSYGGFDTLTKNGSYQELDIEDVGDGLTFSFRFRQEVGGTMDLLSRLPTTAGADGKKNFVLQMGKISNEDMARLDTNFEWYRESPWDAFDPSSVDPSLLESVALVIWPETRSSDGWIDTNALFADNEVTIGVHFGWDYHNNYHLVHSEDIYDWLLNRGFESPVSSYSAYTRQSGPLTKAIQYQGRSVMAKVWLFWGQPGTEVDPDTDSGGVLLENDMRESFKTREVIIFSGHSGPFYGFALANWRKTLEGDLDDSEIPSLEMPSDTYQVVLAEGCETYALGEAFWQNPNKPQRKLLDILTTTSFSNAGSVSTVTTFLSSIVGVDANGNQSPRTYMELLQDLNGSSSWFNTMYGVHGIDDNPHLHPYVEASKMCQPCSSDSACGPAGYKCAKINGSQKACFGRCTADDGCPDGYQCLDVASGTYKKWKVCAPATLSCP